MASAPDTAAESGSRPDDELPSTAYAVLGILTMNDEELSPGEIKTRATYGMRHYYWAPAVSHIRRELRRLLSLGMVDERDVVIGRIRRGQLYRTTEAGDRALARWVAESPPHEPEMVKDSVLLRVALGSKARPEVVLDILDARIAQVEDDIEEFTWGLRRSSELGLPETENLRFPMAVAEYTLRGLYFKQANLRQLRSTIVGFDTEAFKRDLSRRRGPLRHRRP